MFKLLNINDFISESIDNSKYLSHELQLCGGAFGHMSHPFEDFSLTFLQVKEIIDLALQGNLDKEVSTHEKLDGLALAISWKNGKLIAARNKTERKSFGLYALSIYDVIDKFKDHPATLNDAFSFAVNDLEKALLNLKSEDLNSIFNEGHNFMHIEILWPDHPNVISYDTSRIVFHTVTEYNEEGNPINDFPNFARKLEKIIISVNVHIQKNFQIIEPISINLPKHIDFSAKKSYFLKKLNKIQSSSNLNDTDKIGDYIKQMFQKELEQHDTDKELTHDIISGLINRWTTMDKSYTINTLNRNIFNQFFIQWIKNFDKKEAAKKLREYILPLEVIFLELGAIILKNASGFLAANPEEAVQKIRKDLDDARKKIESSNDVTLINTLQLQMAKIDAIGGFDSILPTEGIVFVYNGKTYKFTGAFAPTNRIIGLLKF